MGDTLPLCLCSKAYCSLGKLNLSKQWFLFIYLFIFASLTVWLQWQAEILTMESYNVGLDLTQPQKASSKG